MEVFPTQYSLLSASALKEKLEQQYGLNDIKCRLLIHNVGDTYILENADIKYIFKIYRDAHRSLDEIKGEVELLNLLHEGGAKVARPVKDLKGSYIQDFNAAEGIRHGLMFTYAEGEVKQEMNDAQLATLGREMARIHEVTARTELSHGRPEFNIQTTLKEPLIRIKPAFTGLETEYDYLIQASEAVIKKMESFDLTSFGYGYCHYDFLPKNFHFDEGGEITFFDFDFAGKGHFVNDLASFYAHFFLMVLQQKMTQEEADRAFGVFIAAYQRVRPISQSELEALPYFGFTWWIFYFGFHYDNFEDWSNFFFGPRFIKERVGLIKKWTDQMC
jgi:Ser/Thr protein kinase RdoA (MazF antagonist)